jgi:hypothetical protein
MTIALLGQAVYIKEQSPSQGAQTSFQKGEVIYMALYDLKMFCNACGEFHALGKTISLDESFPVRSASIAFKNTDIPLEIVLAKSRRIQCPITDRWVTQPNADRILLVASQ